MILRLGTILRTMWAPLEMSKMFLRLRTLLRTLWMPLKLTKMRLTMFSEMYLCRKDSAADCFMVKKRKTKGTFVPDGSAKETIADHEKTLFPLKLQVTLMYQGLASMVEVAWN